MGAEADAPPLAALQCPSPLGHSQLAVRERWFYCRACQQQYETAWDDRSGQEITHAQYRSLRR